MSALRVSIRLSIVIPLKHNVVRCCAVLACLLLWAGPAGAQWLRAEEAIMGTRVMVEIWHEDPKIAQRGADAVFAEMRRIDALMSPYKEQSELYRINAQAAAHPVPVGEELAGLIEQALKVSELTDGAFDITFASVGYMYDYRERRRPDEQTIQAALPAVDYHLVQLDRAAGTIRFQRPGVRIDLGGIAKGYAVERGAAILRELGVAHAHVNAGGDSRMLGDRHGRPWVVGIRDPQHKDTIVAKLPLVNEAISTSGDYERYFDEEGVRYHHILVPKTGTSAREVHSATVIGADATTTDALSTSIFVMGPQRGLALIDRLEGIEAVIVDREGRIRFSAGLERRGAGAK